MSTFISGVANPNTKPRRRPRPPPKPKLTKEELEAMIQQRRDDIKINIPTFLNNNPSTTLHPFLGGKIDILSESFGNKPPIRKPNIGTKNTAEASVEK